MNLKLVLLQFSWNILPIAFQKQLLVSPYSQKMNISHTDMCSIPSIAGQVYNFSSLPLLKLHWTSSV